MMETTAVRRVLPADVYDALEREAALYGGVGRSLFFSPDGNPCCIAGYARQIERDTSLEVRRALGDALQGPDRLISLTNLNDEAVYLINGRSGQSTNARVPFTAWCAELGVVRGDQ